MEDISQGNKQIVIFPFVARDLLNDRIRQKSAHHLPVMETDLIKSNEFVFIFPGHKVQL